jgi:co-chaperonin GroES (HSP10)
MNYLPLQNKVLVIENEKKKVTDSGIYLGEANGDSNTRAGTVLAIGPDVQEVKVGDIVYPMWTKAKVVREDNLYLGIISEEDILAVQETE